MIRAIPIVALRRKHLKILTPAQAKERMRRSVLCCNLRKAWINEFPEEIINERKRTAKRVAIPVR